MAKFNRKVSRDRRHTRIRRRVQGTETRPRLSVFRSLTNVYAQVIDDTKGLTLAAASSLDAEIKTAADGKKEGRSIQNWSVLWLPNGLRKEVSRW